MNCLSVMFRTLALFVLTAPAFAADRFTGPWDLKALGVPPAATWGKPKGVLREVYYENVPLRGKPTRVFAYCARPTDGAAPFPAMVLLHGGGGKAFAEWATLWAERGYVALAMDLSGRGPDGMRLADGGPEQSDEEKFRDFDASGADRMWTYHAVAAAIRGHSLLASLPYVDRDRIGVTGISWGGYLTCIVAGIDDRLKVAVPVYGCGFLDEGSYWVGPHFKPMGPERTRRWADRFDPSRYLPGVTCPILFVNGTNDFAYPLDIYRKSYRLVSKAPVDLCVTVKMPHGHSQGWAPKEIGLFVDSIFKGGAPLPRLTNPVVAEKRLEAEVRASLPIRSARLHYSTDRGPWQGREWTTVEAKLAAGRVSADLPATRPIAAFFTVEDERGAVASSPHATEN
jgi:dienelactone hydrolase